MRFPMFLSFISRHLPQERRARTRRTTAAAVLCASSAALFVAAQPASALPVGGIHDVSALYTFVDPTPISPDVSGWGDSLHHGDVSASGTPGEIVGVWAAPQTTGRSGRELFWAKRQVGGAGSPDTQILDPSWIGNNNIWSHSPAIAYDPIDDVHLIVYVGERGT